MIFPYRQSWVSALIISAILHSIAMLAFIWVKLETGGYSEANIPVTFAKLQKTKVLRRSMPVRELHPKAMLSQKPFAETIVKPRPANINPGFYISKATHQRAFVSKNIGHIVVPETAIQKPRIEFEQQPVNIVVSSAKPRTVQTNIGMVSGYELIGKTTATMEKKPVDIDADNALQRFLISVRKKIESKKKYPLAARDAGIEGKSGIKMTILKDGKLESVEITESSGSEILDDAALQSVRSALPFPSIPDSVSKDKVEVSLYLVFKINSDWIN